MTDKEKYERLKNAIRVFSSRTRTSEAEWYQLKDEHRFKESVLRRGALQLGEKLLEGGFLEIQEWDDDKESPFGAAHVYQMRVEVLLPDAKPGHFSKQIDDAEKSGFLRAVAEISKAANLYETLGGYGPVQALALRGVAQEIKRKNPQ